MKHKLIKINKLQYIVVDETDVKTLPYKSWFFDTNSRLVGQYFQGDTDVCWRKITHSTQPLEATRTVTVDKLVFYKIKPLSLSEVEELINGYSFDYKLEDFEHEREKVYLETGSLTACEILNRGISLGFEAHQEIVKDKLFTIEDMQKAIQMSRLISDGKESFDAEDISGCTEVCTYDWKFKHNDYDIIQSLLPKTEWDVEFDENGKLKLIDK
jgi:hypothetical protein